MWRWITAACLIALAVSAAIILSQQGEPEIVAQQTEKLFSTAPGEVRALAEDIEAGRQPEVARLAALGEGIDSRYGEDITLMFHALSLGNVGAVEALLAAGADPTVTDKASGSERDLLYWMGSPGGDLIETEGLNRILRAYLAAGHSPNALHRGKEISTPLIMLFALAENIEGMDILLAAGADPWARRLKKGVPQDSSALSTLTLGFETHFDYFDSLIDRGVFDEQGQRNVEHFLQAIGGYAQRGDETSLRIKDIAMRVLKRNPDYVAPDNGLGAQRIFKDHYEDPGAGEIPWDLIRSDAVR